MSTIVEMDKKVSLGTMIPSPNYMTLENPISGTKYTAPANGYAYLYTGIKDASKSCFGRIDNLTMGIMLQNQHLTSYGNVTVLMPCKKGDEIQVYFENVNIIAFKFYYAEGEYIPDNNEENE